MRSGAAFAICILLAAGLVAQVPQPGQDKGTSVSKVERKNKAPVSKEILRVKLPQPVEVTLDNGLTVMIMEDNRFPTVSVQLWVNGAGGLFEPSDLPGLASATAALIREGTKTRTSRQIAEEIDNVGATLSANTGFSALTTNVNASGLSDNLDDWFALMVDVVMNPTFPADEVEKYKARQKVQLKQQRSQPQFLATERFNKAVYGNHPASVVAPTEASIDALTSEKLAAWHNERYVPQGSILGIAGDVKAQELLPKLRRWFGAWKRTDLKVSLPPNPSAQKTKMIHLVDRPNSVQTTLSLGNIAIDRLSPDYVPVVVMNRIIGGGPAARLFINLREEKGYTYGVYSNFTAVKFPGPWSVSGDFRTEVTDGAMTELLAEIKRIREEKVPEAELDEAKRAMVASFALSLEQPTQLLNYALQRKLYDLPKDYWDKYPAQLMAVKAEDVMRVAQQYLNPDAMQVVAVGDASKIKPVLEKYGPVQLYNTEGKLMQN
jgi:zinc protease